jgi:tetratricopeptide (TPR) repeat protein
MPIADLAFEHRMYLPLAPVLSLATLGMIAVSQRLPIRPTLAYRQFAALASIAVLALAIRTAVRNLDYLSPLRMWHSVVAVSPWNFRAHHQLALQYESRGMVAQAEHHFAETLRCRPDAWWVDIGLGNLRVRQNRMEEAEAHFRKALAVKAGTALATANLARLYERRGDWPQAVRFYEASVDANPRNLDIRMAKARAHEKAGQIPQAIQAYREILNLDPRSREAKAALDKLPVVSGRQPDETNPPISITNE